MLLDGAAVRTSDGLPSEGTAARFIYRVAGLLRVCESTDQGRKRPTVFGRIDSVICAVIAVQVASPGPSLERRVRAPKMRRFGREVYAAICTSKFRANSLMRLNI
jgi:hypothetical protein